MEWSLLFRYVTSWNSKYLQQVYFVDLDVRIDVKREREDLFNGNIRDKLFAQLIKSSMKRESIARCCKSTIFIEIYQWILSRTRARDSEICTILSTQSDAINFWKQWAHRMHRERSRICVKCLSITESYENDQLCAEYIWRDHSRPRRVMLQSKRVRDPFLRKCAVERRGETLFTTNSFLEGVPPLPPMCITDVVRTSASTFEE